MLFTTLRGLGKITCQTFKPLNQSFRQNTHFQNGAPFIFDKVFITHLRMPITEGLPLCGLANIFLKVTVIAGEEVRKQLPVVTAA